VGTVLAPPAGAKEQGLRVQAILAHPDAERWAELGEAVVKGTLVLPVERSLPLSRGRVAQHIAEGGGIGKILLVA